MYLKIGHAIQYSSKRACCEKRCNFILFFILFFWFSAGVVIGKSNRNHKRLLDRFFKKKNERNQR